MILQITPEVAYASRHDWGANVKRLGHLVDRRKRTEAIFHHVVAVDRDATPNVWETQAECFQRMRGLQTCRPDLGRDVPYSYVVFLMADNTILVCEGRGPDRTGAHTHGHNTVGIGIALYGDFRLQTNMTAYIRPLSHFLGWLKLNQAMPNLAVIIGHSNTTATVCPGGMVKAILGDLAFLPYAKGDELSSKEYQELKGMIDRINVRLDALQAPPAPAPAPTPAPPPAPTPTPRTYTVVSGDELGEIALKYKPAPMALWGPSGAVAVLAAHNNIAQDSIIHPGQVLRIPW